MATTIQLSVETIRRNAVQKRDIALLQSLLAGRGLLGWEIDGVFGPVTERAVKAFQAQCGLDTDGTVGPLTWGKLTGAGQASITENITENRKTISGDDYSRAADLLGVDVATIRAVCDVETSGSGFLPDGRPKILFEGHVFWRELRYGLLICRCKSVSDIVVDVSMTMRRLVRLKVFMLKVEGEK